MEQNRGALATKGSRNESCCPFVGKVTFSLVPIVGFASFAYEKAALKTSNAAFCVIYCRPKFFFFD